MKNNADLVEVLIEFEQTWGKGKNHIIESKRCNQLLHFSNMLEATCDKYKEFKDQVDYRDTVIFVVIPALLLLKNMDTDDKDLCKTLFPPMFGEPMTD